MRITKSIMTASIMAMSLALSACGDSGTGATSSAEPLAAVAPPQGTQWRDVVNKSDENGYVIGNPDAPIKLIEYAALTCGACAAFEQQAYGEIFDTYIADGRVSFEIRNFLLNPYGIPLGILTRCGEAQSYPALTEQVFKNQAAILQGAQAADPKAIQAALAKGDEEKFVELAELMNLYEFFKARGISEDQARSCLANPAMAKELIDMTEKGVDEFKVEGTPSFYINGQQVDYTGWDGLKTKLQEAGAR